MLKLTVKFILSLIFTLSLSFFPFNFFWGGHLKYLENSYIEDITRQRKDMNFIFKR